MPQWIWLVAVRAAVVALVCAVVLVPAAAAAPPSDRTSEFAAAKPCKKGSKAARIAGKRVCVKVGQRCKPKLDRQYHRAKLHCVRGRLAKRHPPSADVLITNSESADPVAAGEVLTYELAVTNIGPDTAAGVKVTNALPAGLALIGLAISPVGAAACAGTTVVTCTIGSLSAGTTVRIELSVRPPAAGSLVNRAAVTTRTRDPNRANNSIPQTTTVQADLRPPLPRLDPGPSSPTTATTATFTFTADEPGSTFWCRLDSGPYAPCTSPKTYTDLAFGTHVFEVVAIDPAGNMSVYPGGWMWQITTECSDSVDNDGDGRRDYPDDSGCSSSSDTTESPDP